MERNAFLILRSRSTVTTLRRHPRILFVDLEGDPLGRFRVSTVKELLIVIAVVVIGSEVVRVYNALEEPQSSRDMRMAAAVTPELK